MKKKRERENQNENANTTKKITLKSSSENPDTIHVNMAKHGNAGRSNRTFSEEIPMSCDLSNWVMDSECTCHMSPYRSDFEPDSLISENRIVEIADGNTVPANLSGTINMQVHTIMARTSF